MTKEQQVVDPVIIWLWDAGGPAGTVRRIGICGNEPKARAACEEAFNDGATSANVEMAKFKFTLSLGRYDRTGVGAAASRSHAGGGITWTPFRMRQAS
jgi:hypothetical protein